MTAKDVINHMKSIFARHGVPETLVSDNGPQYASREFEDFTRDYDFIHVTSSPRHPSGNGEAERAVRTIKNLLKFTEDPYSALLNYRATPLSSGYSPAELLMSRKLRTKLPIINKKLEAKLPDRQDVQEKHTKTSLRQKQSFDTRHRAKPLRTLEFNDEVWIDDRQESGTISSQVAPRSYIVDTPSGTYRRNRRGLSALPLPPQNTEIERREDNAAIVEKNASSSTRSGRKVVPPSKYNDYV